MRAVDPDEYLDMDDSDADDFEAIPDIWRTIRCLRQQTELAQSILRCPES